jgi:hypothetical protein
LNEDVEYRANNPTPRIAMITIAIMTSSRVTPLSDVIPGKYFLE